MQIPQTLLQPKQGSQRCVQPAPGCLAALPLPGAVWIVSNPPGGRKNSAVSHYSQPAAHSFGCGRGRCFSAPLALPSHRSGAATPPPCFGGRWECPDAASSLREVCPAPVSHPEPAPEGQQPPVFLGTGAIPTPASPRRHLCGALPPASPALSPPRNDLSEL